MQRLRRYKAWLIGAVFSLMALTGSVQAATSDSIDLHVSIAGTKEILILGTTSYDFGALNVNTSSVTVSSIIIQNNSPVFVETFTITGANAVSDAGGEDWTLASSTGVNQYALAAQFSANRPNDNDSSWASDSLTTSASTCSATDHGNGTEGEGGSNVGVNETRGLWFRIKTPSSVSDGSQHTVTVTVSVL